MGNPLQHKARKRFGQNFLRDPGIINRIVRSIAPQAEDFILEIGPGQGAITAPLIRECANLQVVEIDRDLIPILLAQFANYPKFKIHQQDVLTFDFDQLAGHAPIRVIGNLPYNISTPLIFHLLEYAHLIGDMHFMLQREVVQRLVAKEGDKHYGRLGIMVQYFCQTELLFDVPPECFEPQPKVDSAIVRLVPHKELPVVANNFAAFAELVTTAFGQRRKTLRNNLKNLLAREVMEDLGEQMGLDLSRRPETVSLAEFVTLANLVSDHKK